MRQASVVRVGYQGPELDEMLAQVGLRTVKRIYNGNVLLQWLLCAERRLRRTRVLAPFAAAAALLVRPIVPLIDALPWRYSDQITVAVKM